MTLVVDVLPNPDNAAKDLGIMNIANTLPRSLAVAGTLGLLGAAVVRPIKKVR